MPPPPPKDIVMNDKKNKTPKELIVEQLIQRYPPLQDIQSFPSNTMTTVNIDEDNDDNDGTNTNNNTTTTQLYTDIRQLYHPVMEDTLLSGSDMDIVFVGTASCTPGVTRGVSCTGIRLNWKRRAIIYENGKIKHPNERDTFNGGTWLFDVGECTQLQIQKRASIKPSKITKIFITHAHGDHSFGLPGLLCLMGQDRTRTDGVPPIEIYGPEGLRMWLRTAIRYSVSRIVPPYRVHEICDVPMGPAWEYNPRTRRYFYKYHNSKKWTEKGLSGEDPTSWITQSKSIHLHPSPLYGEIDGGQDIYPIYNHPLSTDGAPVWEVVTDETDVQVYAAPMSHGIPCLGYVVQEEPRPGRLRNEYVEPIVKRNLNALKNAGFTVPMKAMAVIKNLPQGSAFTFPDGTIVKQEDAVKPPRRGRKVVICGDTCNSRALKNLAQDADVVIHECTNAYIPGVDTKATMQQVTKDAIIHGHSTPQIAGQFCKSVNGQMLILNHFSARYKGDISIDSMSIMLRIEQQAIAATGLPVNKVAAAWDLMVLPVPSRDETTTSNDDTMPQSKPKKNKQSKMKSSLQN